MTTKNYLQILFFLAISGLITSCSQKSDLNRLCLRGNVKTYLEKHYDPEMKFGEWINGDIQYGHSRVSFDKEGNYEWIEYLDNNFELSGKLIPTRENGEVIVETYYDVDGKPNNKTKISRNSIKELEFIACDKDGKKLTQGKSFFADSRVIKQQYQTFENNMVNGEYTVAYEYDKDGNLISQKQINKKGEVTYFYRFRYLTFDKNNNWTKRLDYDSEKSEEPKTIVIREYEYY